MKPRTVTTSRILAVALGTASGCTPASAPAPRADVVVAPEPRTTAAEAPPPPDDAPPASAPSPVEAAAEGSRSAPPEPAAPELVALREELLDQDRDHALGAAARFRPLCDADGYPLVGNVMRKSGPLYQPSAFCSDVRARARR